MARSPVDEDEEKPLDPAVENVRRKLVRFVGINLGLLFVALMAVVGAIVYKSGSAPDRTPAEVAEFPPADGSAVTGDIRLPAGARIVSQSLSGSLLSIDAELADGGRAILLYDLASHRFVGKFAVTTE